MTVPRPARPAPILRGLCSEAAPGPICRCLAASRHPAALVREISREGDADGSIALPGLDYAPERPGRGTARTGDSYSGRSWRGSPALLHEGGHVG